MKPTPRFWICLLAAFAMVLGWTQTAPATGNTIVVSETATVHRNAIFLGDVARIQGSAPGETARLARVPLGTAPSAGQRRRIPLSHIERSLTRSGFDVAVLDITSPASITVSRASNAISRSQLEKIAVNYLLTRIGKVNARVTVKAVRGAKGFDLPGGRPVKYTSHTASPINIRRPVPVKVAFRQDGRVVRTQWVTVELSIMTPVLVTVRPVARYQPISSFDVRIEERDATVLPAGILIDPTQAIGKRAVRMIPAGTPLVERLIDLPALVRRGDIVQIIAERGPLRITARGEARSNGRRGDRIPVRNLDSRKQISARVVDAQTVHVEF